MGIRKKNNNNKSRDKTQKKTAQAL